ncbi:hypothetical protein RDWZM_002524 [Blomia tropicalis]|uniref:Bursicon subunit alpha n=1 Tax=Blomia tropicalis TaxID=40697 RepID=A0A9Q0MDY0_BLOTA|nr:hypothetical protein RDWZM_002524 [Blomia tropicalis]
MALAAYMFHVQATIPFQTDDDLFDVIKFSKIPTLTNPDGYRNKKSASTVRFSDLSESTDLSSSVATDSVQKCKTVKNSIHVSKEDRSSTGETLRVCEGVIQVNKCEGVCLSNLRPSVNTATGLVKDCICCRERMLHRKEVTLEICFDNLGARIPGTMTITIPEPRECGCFRCA